MAEGYYHGSEEVHELVCDPCQHDGQTIEAEGFCVDCNEFLCETCSSYHTKQKPCRNHKVLGRDKMPQQKTDMKTVHAKTEYDECSKHVGKSLKYFCGLHKDFGCSVCMTIGHRGCEDVQYIPEVVSNITKTEEFLTFERKLRNIAEAANEHEKKVQKNIDDMEKCNTEIKKNISQFREEINSYLDKLEKLIRLQADGQIKKINKELDIKLQKYNQLSLDVKNLETEIENLVETGQNNRLFTKMKTQTTYLKSLEEKIHILEMKKSVKALAFKPIFNNAELQRKIPTFGTLLGPGSLKFIRSVNVKSCADFKTCTVVGLVVMPDGRCVLADSANNKIKRLDKDLVKVISEANIEKQPRGICKMNDNEVAITYASTIQYFSINDTIDEGRKLKFSGDCYALTFNNKKEQLLTCYRGQIHVIDINELKIETKGPCDLINDYSGISLTSDNSTIYVSHTFKDKVTSLTSDVIKQSSFTAKDMKCPRGTAVDHKGCVYVCGYKSNTIHVIRPGQVSPQLLLGNNDNLESPLSVAVSDNDRQLLVGSDNSDVIKLFQLY